MIPGLYFKIWMEIVQYNFDNKNSRQFLSRLENAGRQTGSVPRTLCIRTYNLSAYDTATF